MCYIHSLVRFLLSPVCFIHCMTVQHLCSDFIFHPSSTFKPLKCHSKMVIRLLHFPRAAKEVKGTLLQDNFSKRYCVFASCNTRKVRIAACRTKVSISQFIGWIVKNVPPHCFRCALKSSHNIKRVNRYQQQLHFRYDTIATTFILSTYNSKFMCSSVLIALYLFYAMVLCKIQQGCCFNQKLKLCNFLRKVANTGLNMVKT